VPDKAIISHRGEKYEIGRGKRFYGIWAVGAPYEAPVDRWPENPSGWEQAWARFATIEAPGTIAAVARERKARSWLKRTGSGLRGGLPRPHANVPLFVGEGLLVLGVVLGLAGLFPAYLEVQGSTSSQSLLSQSDQLVGHLFYVIGWAVSAALIALSVVRPATARLGALFGLGLGVVTFGFFLADLGQATESGVSAGSGLVVSLLGWLACTAGSAVALAIKPAPDSQPMPAGQPEPAGYAAPVSRPGQPGRKHAGAFALLVLAAIGTAVAFFPSWDSYTLVASGRSQTITAGNAFTSHNPGLMVAGDVAVMVAIVVMAALAALWRPPRQGALLLAGATVPLVGQAVSALIQVSQPVSPTMFGISQAQAQAVGLKISAGVTPIYWVFFVFVISLLVSCAWLFTEPGHPAMPAFSGYGWASAGPDASAETDDAPSEAVTDNESQDAESEASGPKATQEGGDSAVAPDGGGQSAYA
jgi:hypothetical protein